jgi:hypothetical protein
VEPVLVLQEAEVDDVKQSKLPNLKTSSWVTSQARGSPPIFREGAKEEEEEKQHTRNILIA